MLAIKLLGIADAKRQMVAAVRVEPLDWIDSLRHLAVAFTEFGTGHAARGENRIFMNETKRAIGAGCVNLERFFRFQTDERQLRGRIWDLRGSEVRFHALA